MRGKHPFRAMYYPVNVYCDRDISCIVIVTYHVLISVEGLTEVQLLRRNPKIVTHQQKLEYFPYIFKNLIE